MEIIKRFFKRIIAQESSPEKLALSFCMGNYIAFSPFPFLHTAMVFLLSWLFRLNFAVTLSSSCFINNPWTLVPIYGADYAFGRWLIHGIFRCNLTQFDPWWMSYINNLCEKTLHISRPCIWSFLIGGNILGIMLSIILYPVMKKIFAQYIAVRSGTPYENNFTK